jgi:hypothetical protein
MANYVAGNYKTCLCLHVQYNVQNSCAILAKFGVSGQIAISPQYTVFQGKPVSRSCADTCGQTDIMKLVGTFCFMRTRLKEYAIHCIIQKLLNVDTKGKNSSVVIGKTGVFRSYNFAAYSVLWNYLRSNIPVANS